VRFVQTASSGTDGYPDWLFEGPIVATASGTGAAPIAEYALAAILMHEKRLPDMFLREGAWTAQSELVSRPLGGLEGRTLGLLGLGQIGSRVARLGAAFGMKVIAHRRSGAPSSSPDVALVDLNNLLARSDHLVIAAPLTDETAGIIGSAALSRVKPSLHIVNVARGGIIDTDALSAALHEGRIAGATLDVTDPEPLPAGHPLWSAPNVRITPHMAWSSADTPRRIFRLFIENVERFARGEALVNQL
jgi:phosphoglycerate dehydrogenase-like enzyme